ncbi:hypothetical protein F5884DRAFT_848060 [Xylogone sp. PMI_703]|nr:hypothetical protein F5884DRAFT_848060 [Xylogone sp. PMI_703]
MSFIFALFHVLVTVVARTSFPLSQSQNLLTLIGASSLGLLILLSFRLFRQPSYELFLRAHQSLAGLFVYSMWRHLPSDKLVPRLYLYISTGLFLSTSLIQCGFFVRTNGLFRYHCSRAHISHAGGAVRIRIYPQKRLKIKTGQYINLWIPFISFWSFAQSHPFVVISWATEEQNTIDLFIEPRRGLTRELLYHTKSNHSLNPLVMFSGPHGRSVSMEGYETILMVASGFGIAAQLPYLKRLIHGYNAREVHARRIHLIWQIKDKEVGIAGQSLLNGALVEDKLDDGYILSISIYWQSSDIPTVPFGKRATLYPGVAPLQQILAEEAAGEHLGRKNVEDVDWDAKGEPQIERTELESGRAGTRQRSGKMLVTVSANDNIRDELRLIVRGYLNDGLSMVELDYQPPK